MIRCELNACISRHISKLISDSDISHSRRSCQERKKGEYINEVYPNGSTQYEKEIHAENSIYCRDINSSPVSLPSCDCVLVCCGSFRKIATPEEESAD